jgi:hypothetical protein
MVTIEPFLLIRSKWDIKGFMNWAADNLSVGGFWQNFAFYLTCFLMLMAVLVQLKLLANRQAIRKEKQEGNS